MEAEQKSSKEYSNYTDIGYQTILNLYIYEGNLTWNRYNVMLVANSILIASIGILFSNLSDHSVMILVLIVAGITLCCFWYSLTQQGFKTCKHYYWSAIDFENRFLKHHANIFSRTELRAKEDSIYLINGKNEVLEKKYFKKKLTVKVCALGSIWIFLIIYCAIFLVILLA